MGPKVQGRTGGVSALGECEELGEEIFVNGRTCKPDRVEIFADHAEAAIRCRNWFGFRPRGDHDWRAGDEKF